MKEGIERRNRQNRKMSNGASLSKKLIGEKARGMVRGKGNRRRNWQMSGKTCEIRAYGKLYSIFKTENETTFRDDESHA